MFICLVLEVYFKFDSHLSRVKLRNEIWASVPSPSSAFVVTSSSLFSLRLDINEFVFVVGKLLHFDAGFADGLVAVGILVHSLVDHDCGLRGLLLALSHLEVDLGQQQSLLIQSLDGHPLVLGGLTAQSSEVLCGEAAGLQLLEQVEGGHPLLVCVRCVFADGGPVELPQAHEQQCQRGGLDGVRHLLDLNCDLVLALLLRGVVFGLGQAGLLVCDGLEDELGLVLAIHLLVALAEQLLLVLIQFVDSVLFQSLFGFRYLFKFCFPI